MNQKAETIARSYLDAIAAKRFDRLEALLAPNVRFVGPASDLTGREALLEAFRRVCSIHVRSDVKRVFSDDDGNACVIYDFVTDTIGALATVEWLAIVNGRIESIHIYYDQIPWQRAREEIARRANASPNVQPNA